MKSINSIAPAAIASSLAWALLACCAMHRSHADLPSKVSFDQHIRPLLSDRCYLCHGPDAENREADLRLDLEQEAYAPLEDGEGTHVVKPGAPERSALFQRISSTDPNERMPPADSNLQLTPAEIDLIRLWIEQGAEWKQHWSFLPVGNVSAAGVKRKDWPRNEIDHFVLARLEDESIAPAAAASREQLIRRLTYDLTGLPPTIAEIDAFLNDPAADAYEKIVDRLLASSRYGERMAVAWLDLARYSDTYGYQADKYRPVWPWRDWVVRAFNQNMPYHDFITWQLAGDLLPASTPEQTLATAFNRLHRQTNEGGSIEEEFRVEYVADRTDTFGTAFLGLTLQCARCHDHKYDPISQLEYYQLSGFFNSIDESGLYSHFTDATPTPALLLAEESQTEQLQMLARQIADAEKNLATLADQRQPAGDAWLEEHARQPPSPAGLIGAYGMETVEDDKIPNRANPEKPGSLSDGPALVPGIVGNGLRLSGENLFSTPVGGSFTRHDPFSIALWINTPDEKERAVIWHRSRAWTDAGSRGYQLLLEQGKLSAALIHFWPGNAIRVLTERKMPIGKWLQVLVTYDGSSRADGLKIYVDGQLEPCVPVRDCLTRTIGYDGESVQTLALGQRFRDRGFKDGLVDELRIYDRELTSGEAAQIHHGSALDELLALPRAGRTLPQQTALRAYYLHNFDPPYRAALDSLRSLRGERDRLVDSIAEIMVMRELPAPRATFLLQRGAYDARRQRVEPGTPASLPSMAERTPKSRLELANWLTDPRHPLTARVAVNRFWQQLFGAGLVRTPEDFGSQGEAPTHPQLLDWLAKSFRDSDWDVKALLKSMVMSATYRQSGDCDAAVRQRDPFNALLAHGPRGQLTAEMLRDGALFAGGLLIEKLGGPPVKPYQPDGLWKEKGTETYQRDQGEGSHRRSLYTLWKRTSPPPAMLTFNATKRDVCAVKRQATATPLQALVLMNDPQFVEASRALAQRAMRQQPRSFEDQLATIFRCLTSRGPSVDEMELLQTTFQQQVEIFQQQPANASLLLAVGDHAVDESLDPIRLAAMTVVAEMVMNFEDSITK